MSDLSDVETSVLIDELKYRLLDSKAAAVYLDTHSSYIWTLAATGKLQPVSVFNRKLFRRVELDRELEERQKRADRIKANAETREQRKRAKAELKGYERWTLQEIQKELKARKLPVKGRKAILIARLEESNNSS